MPGRAGGRPGPVGNHAGRLHGRGHRPTGRRGGGTARPVHAEHLGAPLDQLSFACLYGTPEKWVDTIGRFGEAGAQHVLTLLVTDDMPGDVDLIVSEVLPQLARQRMGLVGA